MKILLPIYAADDTKLIVDFVSNYRWPPRPEFKLVHVTGGHSANNAVTTVTQIDVERLVEDVCQRLLTVVPSAEMSWQIIEGEPVDEILTVATDWRADMIVMGYRKRKSNSTAAFASVAKAVVKDAPCSVVIISPPKENLAAAATSATTEAIC